jgi:hypothetical protein
MIDASLLQGPHRDARAVNYAEHPYFYHSGLQFPWTADVYDSNPWYNAPWFASAPGNDNNRLYVDPSKPLWCGTLHPPLTTFNDPDTFIPRESFLFRNDIAHGVYVWDFTPQQLFTYSVGSRGWGLGGSPPGETVPYLPGSDWHGIRINLELLLPEFPDWVFYGDPQNNIQTFLILQGFGADAPEIPDPNGATSSARSSAATDLRLYEGSTSYDRAVLLLRGDRPR